MAEKDNILLSFMEHEIISTKYNVDKNSLPKSFLEAKNSNIPIIKSIAEIVDAIDGVGSEKKTEKQTFELLTRLLNS
jgi:hypothetical protein